MMMYPLLKKVAVSRGVKVTIYNFQHYTKTNTALRVRVLGLNIEDVVQASSC